MKTLILTLLSVYLSFLAGFAGFYFINKYFMGQSPARCPKCTYLPSSNEEQLDLIDLDILLASPDDPNILFLITKLNNKVDNYEKSFVTFTLDGSTLETIEIPYESIKWEQVKTHNDNSEYAFSGSFLAKGHNVSFSVPSLRLGTVIRAQQMAGKYGGATSQASANLTIDNKQYAVFAGATAGFFADFPQIAMGELGIITHWLMYFDKDWNFYHLDLTNVQNPTLDYSSHAFMSEINAVDQSVHYFQPFKVVSTANSLILDFAKGTENISMQFRQSGESQPYNYAKAHIVKENTGGNGVYLFINSAAYK